MAITPALASAGDRLRSLLHAPRSLNEPVNCWFSSFSTTAAAPVAAARRGADTAGVRTTWPAMVSAAARMSSMVTVIGFRRSGGGDQGQDITPLAHHSNIPVVAPANQKIAVVARERIARLSTGDHEAGVVEVGQIEDGAHRRAMDVRKDGLVGLIINIRRAAVEGVVIAIGLQRLEQPAAEQRHTVQ